jgi:hypothetical protein
MVWLRRKLWGGWGMSLCVDMGGKMVAGRVGYEVAILRAYGLGSSDWIDARLKSPSEGTWICSTIHLWPDREMSRCIDMGGKFVFHLMGYGEKRRWLEGKGVLYGVQNLVDVRVEVLFEF